MGNFTRQFSNLTSLIMEASRPPAQILLKYKEACHQFSNLTSSTTGCNTVKELVVRPTMVAGNPAVHQLLTET